MTLDDKNGNSAAAKKSGLFWMFVPVGLLVTSVSGWLVMVSMAVDDPGFSVEPDYYKKASNYDSVIDQRAENGRLLYGVEVLSFAPTGAGSAKLILSVKGPDGDPLTKAHVTADARPVARAFDVQELSLRQGDAGVFEAHLERPRAGLWEVRVRVDLDGRVFTRVLRPELLRSTTGLGTGEGTPPA